MAKDNLFLGTARGSVGDVTFSRLNGVQVARVRNRSPRNPQSPAQMVQRIIMSSVGKAYSFMQEICNHSFEGFDSGQLSQRKFMETNVGLMRDKVATVLAYPVEEIIRTSSAFNFSFKNDYAPVLNQYQISAGSLPSLPLYTDPSGVVFSVLAFDPGELSDQTMTYADFVQLLGIQRGDQLTFVQASHDASRSDHDTDILTGFRFARVILEPSDGDMSTLLLANGNFNKPNERNQGEFNSLAIINSENAKGFSFTLRNIDSSTESRSDKALAASAVILSRQVGGRWLRSTQFLMPRLMQGNRALNHSTLSLAYESYRLGAASDLYLNQAE